jgi:hypothetical protein
LLRLCRRADSYGGNVVHKVTMDGSEKLMFGYDQSGKTAVYTR